MLTGVKGIRQAAIQPERVAMTFEIQWTGHQGAAMTHRDTLVETIKFAIEMLGKDFTDVVIVDLAEGGKTYTPAEFARLRGLAR